MTTNERVIEVKGADTPAEESSPSGRRMWLRNPWMWIALVGFVLMIIQSEAATFTRITRDEGTFLTIAQEILNGRIPYRDAFDQKAPAIYYLLAGLLALTSHLSITAQLLAARALVTLTNLLTAAGLIILGRRWWRLEVGIIAALLWLFIVPLYEGNLLLTEPFSTALTVWAVVVLVQWPGMRGALGAGLLLALSSLFKQTALLVLPGVALVLLAQTTPGKAWWRLTRQQIIHLALLVAGMILPWLVAVLLFTLAGALQPLYNQVVIANFHYPADPLNLRVADLVTAVQAMPLIFVVPPIVVVAGIVRWLDRRTDTRRVPGIGAVASAMLVAFNLAPFYSHAYLHYWLQVGPWSALLTALGLMAVVDWLRPFVIDFLKEFPPLPSIHLGQRSVGLGKPLLLALLGIALLVGSVQIARSPTYHSGYQVLREQIAVGPWIARYTPPGARLLVAPAEPEFYYLSGHLPAATYIYLLPVNLSPALVAQVLQQIQTEQFDRIVWYESYDTYAEPAATQIYQQITAHYRSVATYDIASTAAPAHLVLFTPNGS